MKKEPEMDLKEVLGNPNRSLGKGHNDPVQLAGQLTAPEKNLK